ncbi:hypothetical protein F4809DRAFT_656004 [Biscogniauxia mediterranea]|nr:hypothetical protein F4809DRAFT_656004 [Biscogniauxia mediterranea]
MHFHTLTAIAFTFLGLGGSFQGVNCAPSSSISHNISSNEVAERHMPHIRPRIKEVPNPFKEPYNYEKKEGSASAVPGVQMYDIYKSIKVNSFGASADAGIFYVSEAWNTYDKQDHKLKLRDLIMGSWVQFTGRKPSDLKTIYCRAVSQRDVNKQIKKAYKELDENPKKAGDIDVTKDSNDDAFEELNKDNPFAVGIQKMIDDYIGGDRKINKFVIHNRGGYEVWDLEVHF